MQLMTKPILQKLLQNGANRDMDHAPVVKYFTPDASATWLISEVDPEDQDLLFGLCDLGLGFPELGYVRLSEIESIRGKLGLKVERDRYWEGKHPMSVYSEAARSASRIVSDPPVAHEKAR